MKLGPVTTKIDATPYRQIVTSLSYSQFMANLDQAGSQILDAKFVKLTFSLIVTSYLPKTYRPKTSNTALTLLL